MIIYLFIYVFYACLGMDKIILFKIFQRVGLFVFGKID